MNKAFEKILERLSNIHRVVKTDEDAEWNRAIYNSTEIVKEVAEEYKKDMKYNLAEMYAKNMVDYGVDVTKEWQTATQQSYALEKAYISGRQYEADRFNELRKEYNNGWIPCSERLPEESLNSVIGWDAYRDRCVFVQYIQGKFQNMGTDDSFDIKAWQPLPEPFKECDSE